MKQRLTKDTLAKRLAALPIGHGLEAKFYKDNGAGTVVVTFEHLECGKTYRVGRSSWKRHAITDIDTLWDALASEHHLEPPKQLTSVILPETKQKMRKEHAPKMTAKERKRLRDYDGRKDVFCHGVGLRRVKLFLNRLVKQGDHVARMYRLALEIEGVNLAAKKALMKYHSDYHAYDKKEGMLRELMDVCREQGAAYGQQHSTAPAATHVIYFDLTGCEQISFHTNMHDAASLPAYDGQWDGKRCSTMQKLDDAIWSRYWQELREKYEITN